MSYTLTPYLVDLDRLRSIAGSQRASLVIELRENYAARLRHRGGAPDAAASPVADALSRIIEGRVEDDPSQAPRYAAALELLCDHVGERLDNEMYQDTHSDFLEEVAAVQDLVDAGPPLSIPHTGDFPVVGHLTLDAARKSLMRLDQLDPHPEPLVNQGRDQYRDWLESAVREGLGIVALYT